MAPAAGSLGGAPDGRRLVYSPRFRHTRDRTDLFIARADGSGTRRLTRTRRRSESGAVWSPDGRRIAFVGRSMRDDEHIVYGIHTISVRGGCSKRIYASDIQRIEDGNAISLAWQPLRD